MYLVYVFRHKCCLGLPNAAPTSIKVGLSNDVENVIRDRTLSAT